MTNQSTYTPPPPRTQEDIDALVAFIQAQVEPLRDAARYDTEECKAFQALLDIAVHIKGSAQAELKRGDEPFMEFHHLAVVARRWSSHPNFQPAWNPYG